jgi:hypothetical protein
MLGHVSSHLNKSFGCIRSWVACVLINPGWVKTDIGRPGASLTQEESVTASKRLIETLGSAESGKFFDYDGREHAW